MEKKNNIYYSEGGKDYTETEYWKERYEFVRKESNSIHTQYANLRNKICVLEKENTDLKEKFNALVISFLMMRESMRMRGEYELADTIRDLLRELGVKVKDKKK